MNSLKLTAAKAGLLSILMFLVMGCGPSGLGVEAGKCDGYEMKAQEGELSGYVGLAECYRKGLGRKRDLILAEGFYIKAVELGSDIAKQNLASMYLLEFEKQGKEVAVHSLLESGLSQKNPKSFYLKGITYLNGIGVEKDILEATKYFKGGAELGHRESKLVMLLGFCKGFLSISPDDVACENLKVELSGGGLLESLLYYRKSELFNEFIVHPGDGAKLYDSLLKELE